MHSIAKPLARSSYPDSNVDLAATDLADIFECIHGAWKTSMERGTNNLTEIVVWYEPCEGMGIATVE